MKKGLNLKNNLFDCRYCGNTFTNECNLKRHIYGHFKYRPYKCLICGDSFTYESKVQKHILAHTMPCACIICTQSFETYDELNNHTNEKHIDTTLLKCPNCKEDFASITELHSHVEICFEESQKKETRSRNKKSGNKINLHKPVLRVDMKSKGKGAIRNPSKQKANIDGTFFCADCSYVSLRKITLQRHIVIHHPDSAAKQEILGCSMCDKFTGVGKSSLQLHMLKKHSQSEMSENGHLENDEDEVDEINNLFLKTSLNCLSDPVKSYICSMCHKSFSTELQAHRHEESKACFNFQPKTTVVLSCELCRFSTFEDSELQTHMLNHTRAPSPMTMTSDREESFTPPPPSTTPPPPSTPPLEQKPAFVTPQVQFPLDKAFVDYMNGVTDIIPCAVCGCKCFGYPAYRQHSLRHFDPYPS